MLLLICRIKLCLYPGEFAVWMRTGELQLVGHVVILSRASCSWAKCLYVSLLWYCAGLYLELLHSLTRCARLNLCFIVDRKICICSCWLLCLMMN